MDKKTFKTSNPVLREGVFDKSQEQVSGSGSGVSGAAADVGAGARASGESMTLQGTVNKSFLLLAITAIAAGVTWHYAFATNPESLIPWAIGSSIVGLVVGLVICMNDKLAPALSPFYAAFKGLAIGCISAFYEAKYPGLVVQSVGLTICVFLALLFAYTSKIVKATENFKLGVMSATMGIFVLYLVNIVCVTFFHLPIKPIYDTGFVGIGLSLFIVTIAALNLVLDFDFIETGVEKHAPKHMEWYGAFGLLVTLIWLYVEILRLLYKLRSK
ncbi:Bax inhibitor-1/YccA family protein [bacterium]|nr:Bax inhibitor-1/YccA family protein [bacterium]QQR57354.1 MAG: Bax inhibitor-1/YccA family protein [Candidatus Melainabacteria bacterium]